ncbi:unnamed protein product [Phaedon cochleariae]|uniref:AAA+ ATPase domain-containing protein n=1 Tax=Phaedon cochleariae TaxID=80249 RepID=A0A9N9SHA6_PHACE|nr:unnamed protein product [Phaedon cochleariae]
MFISFISTFLLIPLVFTDCWSYNPICWFRKCEIHDPSSTWRNTFYSNYNPYCAVWGCPRNKPEELTWKIWNPYRLIQDWSQPQKNERSFYKFIHKPYCWFYDCNQQKEEEKTNQNNFWNNFDVGLEKSWFPQEYNPVCWVGSCSKRNEEKKIRKEPCSVWSKLESSSLSSFQSTKEWVMSSNPRRTVQKTVSFLNAKPVCWFLECCNDYYIPGDIENLRKKIKRQIYGQPLISTVVDALNSHWNMQYKPTKALVMSFHGWTGSGKTYVSNLIAESMFERGTKSQYFHHFHGRKQFTLENKETEYKEELLAWLRSNVTDCPKQLFVFDEIDKMPDRLLDSIKPMLDHRALVDGADYTRAVFVFISNAGSEVIVKHLERLLDEREREEVELRDFEGIIVDGAFNEKGGLHQSEAISDNLIDHYIPFLPLERRHIVNCTKDEFKRRKVLLKSPRDDHVVSEIVDSLHWDLGKNKQFSKTGCKSIRDKVAVAVRKYFKEPSNEPEKEKKTDL